MAHICRQWSDLCNLSAGHDIATALTRYDFLKGAIRMLRRMWRSVFSVEETLLAGDTRRGWPRIEWPFPLMAKISSCILFVHWHTKGGRFKRSWTLDVEHHRSVIGKYLESSRTVSSWNGRLRHTVEPGHEQASLNAVAASTLQTRCGKTWPPEPKGAAAAARNP